MLGTFDRFGVALQAEAVGPQQIRDCVRADPVPVPGQLGREPADGLDRPPQRGHRITPLIRLDQRQQRHPQTRIHLGQPLTTTADTPDPPQHNTAAVQIPNPARRPVGQQRAVHHRPDPHARRHEPTRAYVDRRRQQGLSTKEIVRCLKRLIARQIYYVIRRLEPVKPIPAAT